MGLCCNETCTVVDSNPAHCGACGRVCASCEASACAADVLATYTSSALVSDLFVDPDDSHLYWTVYGGNDPSAGGVFRRSLATDDAPNETILGNTPQYASVAVQGAQMIVTIAVQTSASGVYRCPKDACSGLTPFGTGLPYYPQGTPHLTVTPTQIAGRYYPNSEQSFRCNAALCNNQSGIGTSYWLDADATRLYRSAAGNATTPGKIETFALNDLNAAPVLYTALGLGATPRTVHAGDDGHLYWHEFGNETLVRGSLGQSPGTIETIATGVSNSQFDMAQRDGILYWIDSAASGWVVESCVPAQCSQTRKVVGSVIDKPTVMAVSSKWIFVGTTMAPGPPSYLERFPR